MNEAEETNICEICSSTIINALIKNVKDDDGVKGICESCCNTIAKTPYSAVVDGEIKK